MVLGPIDVSLYSDVNQPQLLSMEAIETLCSLTNQEIAKWRVGVTTDMWESVNTVATLMVFRSKWYMVVSATKSFEVLRMYCLDEGGELNENTGDWADIRNAFGIIGNSALREVCRTKSKSEIPERSDFPEIVNVSVQGTPGSILGMMFAHYAIAPCNSNPVWIKEVASLLLNPKGREKALDNLKLSLASGRHL